MQKQIIVLVSHPSLQIARQCQLVIHWHLLRIVDKREPDGINFAWRNGASVISNSWSSSVAYSIINDAISNALTSGRSGKGCVVVFATGNDYSSTVGYPANCNPDILAVGSNNRNGSRSSFSNYGTALDIVAPGENVCTTTGSNYSTSISGTSFSCPTVCCCCGFSNIG
ncbi:S8 family serine peptidase [Bacteroides thetaiotaomicron]|nr:S8 family serine peptidase [Bacteroides thetaiotaomicron]